MPDIPHLIRKITEPIMSRVKLVIGRGVVTRVDDARMMQEVQVTLLKGEVLQKVEHFQPSGFSSVPLEDAEVVVACVGGLREHPIAIVVDDRRHRPTGLEPGECRIYHPTSGNTITLRASGDIEIAGGTVAITGDVTISGDLDVAGDISDGNGQLQGFRTVYNSHVHLENGAGGGITDPTTQTV